MSTFRTKSVMVSQAVFEGLRALYEMEGYDCLDAMADVELGKALSSRGQLEWAKKRLSDMRKQFTKEYRERVHAIQTGIQDGAQTQDPPTHEPEPR